MAWSIYKYLNHKNSDCDVGQYQPENIYELYSAVKKHSEPKPIIFHIDLFFTLIWNIWCHSQF